MIFPYAETSLWYLIDRSGLSYLIYGIFGVIARSIRGQFYFLKNEGGAIFVISFYFWQQSKGIYLMEHR